MHPGVVLYPGALIGDRVILHAGVVVGSDGFGYVFDGGELVLTADGRPDNRIAARLPIGPRWG